MNKLDRLAIAAKTRATMLKDSFKESLTSKKLGDSQVVVALILIVVAIGLCYIFRKQVNDIIELVATNVKTAVNNLSSGAGNGTYTPGT